MSATREQVIAFRLRNHHLAERLSPGDHLAALAACGVQDSPPGSAALSLHARVWDLQPDDADRLLQTRAAVQIWAMRAAPYLIRAADMPIFTTGLLPDDDAALRHYIQGATDHLAELALTAAEAVRLTGAALPEALSGRSLTKDALAAALASAVAPALTAKQRALWVSPDGWRSNTHGETVVRFALSVLSLQGRLCLLPGKGGAATEIVLAGDWVTLAPAAMPREEAAAELLRRYLHCYGPSTAADYALWAGISRPQADRAWAPLSTALEPVSVEGKERWLLTDDRPALQHARMPQGVRLLPPHDPYLQARERLLLVAEPARRQLTWQTVGSPGVVLVDGEIAGVWRPKKRGKSLTVSVQPFRPVDPGLQASLEAEAESLGPFRGADSVALRIEG